MAGGNAPDETKGQPGLFQAALFGTCPQCGAHTLFKAPAQVAGECRVCALGLAELEWSGRLAGMLTIFVAALLVTAAIALDEFVRPPIWVHVVLWVPLTVSSVLYSLRLFKTAGVYSRFDVIHSKP
ncbi:MAG: DUF983 domain-containing protein [Pseudomonadota bacterium]